MSAHILLLVLAFSEPQAPRSASPPRRFAAPSPPPPVHFKARLVPDAGDASIDVQGLSLGLVGDRAARLRGLQLTLVYAEVDDLHGVQFGLLFNFVNKTLAGAEIAAGANLANRVDGAQLALGLNYSDALSGVQIAGANTAGEAQGFQLGIYNYASDLDGAQLGFVNGSEQVRGASLGLLLNIAHQTSGLQLAPINFASEVEGLQVGVMNVAERTEGESLALLTLAGNGIHELALYASDTMWMNLAAKLGGRHLYTAFVSAYSPGDQVAPGPRRFERGTQRFGLGGGLGWRAPIVRGRLESLEIEATALTVHGTLGSGWNDSPWVSSLRINAAIRVIPKVAVLVGLGANLAIAPDGQDADVGLGLLSTTSRSGQTTFRFYPGVLLGVQI